MVHKLIAGLANRNSRRASAEQLANYYGCTGFIFFIKDSSIDMLLPALEFPQTLPINIKWLEFFSDTTTGSFVHGVLPYPDDNHPIKATGIKSNDQSLAILLGGHPKRNELDVLVDLLPLLTCLFINEQNAVASEAKAVFAEKEALKAENLTKTVDGMRQILKISLEKQEADNARIEDLLKKKDEFMNIASHELRTPMTSLKVYMQLLQREDTSSPPKALAENGLRQLRRLENLINDLMHVSKISNGVLEYNMKEFDFFQLVRQTVDSLQITSRRHRLIVSEVPKVTITGDRERLEQVLINYISNAVKYSPDANEVVISARTSENNLIVSVQDFGIGIEENDTRSIFNRFYRVDNTAMKFEGLGLGLYISSEIINRHNGNCWVESEKGFGSTFHFTIPTINL